MIEFAQHAFHGFDASLKRLFDRLLAMGSNVEGLLALMPDGIEEAGTETLERARQLDKKINEAEIETDAAVADIVAQYTTAGEDLRFILGSIKVAGAIERLADRIKNCIKRLSKMPHPLDGEIKTGLMQSIAALKSMLPLCLAQLTEYDTARSAKILEYGANVQRNYRKVLLRLSHLELSPEAMHPMLLVAKNMDQASDMAIEIMKIAHYIHFGTKYERQQA
ncbi:MAG: PhoU domain-containing protein [Alphaproteobacteria bacterium]